MFSCWNHLWKIVNRINIFSYWNHFWRIVNQIQIQKKKDVPINVPVDVPNIYLSNEDSMTKFAKLIEVQLGNLEDDKDFLNICNYTYIVIDGIYVYIFVRKEPRKLTYSYHITFSHHYAISDDEEIEDRYICGFQKKGCKTILSILEEIEEVKTYYKFMEHELLSPEDMKYAKMQRAYFPMHPDKKCSVCYEPTFQYTVCNHLICFRCRFTCIDSGNFMCPICRKEELKLFPSELE